MDSLRRDSDPSSSSADPGPPTQDAALAAARHLIQQAEAVLATEGTPAAQASAQRHFEAAIQQLEQMPPAPGSPAYVLLASTWIRRGNALRDGDLMAHWAEMRVSYDRAVELLSGLPLDGDPAVPNELANAWINQGIALLGINVEASLIEAVECFDRGIQIRQPLLAAGDAWFRYGLVAGWMNRGDALTRLGGAARLEEALRSYDEALQLLAGLPLDEHPLFRRRLGIAWLNRGITLLAQDTPASRAEAIRSFDEVLTCSRAGGDASGNAADPLLIASALTNRATVLLRAPTERAPEEARQAVLAALVEITDREKEDPLAAEAGLKARHVLCVAAAPLLARNAPAKPAPELLAEVTDAIDEGLRIARHWEAQDAPWLRPLALELFRFGGRVYEAYQPHFLAEFLLENLDPERSPGAIPGHRDWHIAAAEALSRSIQRILQESLSALHTPEGDRMLATLSDLRDADTRLRALGQLYLRPEPLNPR